MQSEAIGGNQRDTIEWHQAQPVRDSEESVTLECTVVEHKPATPPERQQLSPAVKPADLCRPREMLLIKAHSTRGGAQAWGEAHIEQTGVCSARDHVPDAGRNQWPSAAIRGHQRPPKAIRSHQRPSEAAKYKQPSVQQIHALRESSAIQIEHDHRAYAS